MTYLDVWRSGTFLLYSCKAAFWIQETSSSLSDVEHSVVLRSVFVIGNTLAYLLFFQECATPPHVQAHHTTWLSFTRPSPTLVLQATNAGVRRPGYEARQNNNLITGRSGATANRSTEFFSVVITTKHVQWNTDSSIVSNSGNPASN